MGAGRIEKFRAIDRKSSVNDTTFEFFKKIIYIFVSMYIYIHVRVVIGRPCVGVRVPSCVEESILNFWGESMTVEASFAATVYVRLQGSPFFFLFAGYFLPGDS